MNRAASRGGVRRRRRDGERLQGVLPAPRPARLRESVAGEQGGRADHARGEVARRDPEGRACDGDLACCATAQPRADRAGSRCSRRRATTASRPRRWSRAARRCCSSRRAAARRSDFPVPTIKVSSNTRDRAKEAALDRLRRRRAARWSGDDGRHSPTSCFARARRRVSGRTLTNNERNGYARSRSGRKE